MKKNWIFGGILFLSIAANITQFAMQAGKSVGKQLQTASMFMERLNSLEEKERGQVAEAVKKTLPELRSQIKEFQQLRKETFYYVSSADYTREEAEKKFKLLREKTTAMQASTQNMIMDISDKLSPEERQKFLKRNDLPSN